MTHCQPSRTRRLLSFCSLLAAAPLAGGLLCQPGHAAEAQAMASPAEASAPAAPQAADHPRLMPARDATIDYVFQPRPPAGGAPVPPPALPVQNRHVQVLFSGDGGLMRINYMIGMDGPESRGAVILNRAAQEVLVILNDRKVYTRLVQQEVARSPFLLDMSMAFTRKGRSTIIGQPCTVWAVHSPRGDGSACVTDDGFILEQDGVDVDGLNGHLKAMKISYDTVPASAFQPPEGFQEVTPHAPGKRGDGEGEAPPPSVMRPGGMPREDHTGAPLASGGMPGVGPVPAIPQAGPAMRDTSDTTP
ncbi:DUF4412 domain-containing protein [Acetobacter farinalis]|uniref:DUF4412 domain-containing protein n=1 Tax=Acetobacter farinalis TaxID=1260984 RepID=A0ABT3Q451_9PROT|nr:DUF4412 domain-containing protein [Acetobacter farinalis]MCX2560064.1 DUF4412 domain-containing protein [Acetobacter farinalis]